MVIESNQTDFQMYVRAAAAATAAQRAYIPGTLLLLSSEWNSNAHAIITKQERIRKRIEQKMEKKNSNAIENPKWNDVNNG